MTKTIRIDGVIGSGENEISASMVREQLPYNGREPIRVVMHSEGGSVFEGFAIHDALKAYQGTKSLSIESAAFSIASFIATAFDDVEITQNGYMMLHNPYAQVEGDDEDLTQQAQLLAKLKNTMVKAYSKRSGKGEDEIRSIMRQETFLDAQQAVAMGFASRINRSLSAVARMPAKILARIQSAKAKTPVGASFTAKWKAAVDAAAVTQPRAKAMAAVDKSHPGLRLKMLAEVNRR